MTSSTVLLYVIAGELGLLLLPEILWGSRWSRRVSVVVSCRRLTLGLVFLLVLVRLVIVEAMARRAERRRRRKWSVRISVSSVVHPQNLTTKKTLLEIHKHFFFANKKKKKKTTKLEIHELFFTPTTTTTTTTTTTKANSGSLESRATK
jgi:hypothetical protein